MPSSRLVGKLSIATTSFDSSHLCGGRFTGLFNHEMEQYMRFSKAARMVLSVSAALAIASCFTMAQQQANRSSRSLQFVPRDALAVVSVEVKSLLSSKMLESKPEDIPIDGEIPSFLKKGFNAVTADVRFHSVNPNTDDKTLKNAISISDGHIIRMFEIKVDHPLFR